MNIMTTAICNVAPRSQTTQTLRFARRVLAAAACMVLISACDGVGGSGSIVTNPPPLPPPPPPGPTGTYIAGKVLDTNSFATDGTELPVVGVNVSFLGEAAVAVTDANGEFLIDNLQAGEKVIDLATANATPAPTGDGYAGFREQIVIREGANEITRPFYLPRIYSASLTTIDPNVDTVVTNAEIGVSLTVFAGTAKDGNGDLFTGQLSISEVPDALAPASLPEDLEPGLLFTIQPVGVIFSSPATLSIRNDRDNWAAGNQIDFWSLDPDLGRFAIVGEGVVSADGSTIETVSGGVNAADWHGPLPPAVRKGPRPPDKDYRCDNCCGPAQSAQGAAGDGSGGGSDAGGSGCSASSSNSKAQAAGPIPASGWGSAVDFHNGRFREYISLPPYVSQNKVRSFELAYASDRAYPVEEMTAAPTILQAAPIPDEISYRGRIAGQDQGYEIFLDASTLQDANEEEFRIALTLDATGLPTDSYVGEALVSTHYPRTTITGRVQDEVNIINDIESEFGAGWRLMGLDRIYPATSGGVLLVDGQGMVRRYVEPNGSGSIVTLIADAPTFNDVPIMQGLIEEMGLPVQLRTVFENANEPQISMDDIADTRLFVWMVGNSFPYFGFAADTVEERSNTLTVFEAAVAQGVPLLAAHIDPSPRDTGYFINPNCCVRDPETGQQENLTGMRRSSNWEAVDAPLGAQRLWQLQDTSHPIFNGPFGTIAPDPASPVADGLGRDIDFNGNTVRPQRLNGSEVPLVRAYQDNGTTTALTNEYPIVVTEHSPLGTPSLTIGLSVGYTAPVDPFIETLIKNAITWLLSGTVTEPGALVSPAGDSSVVTLLEDGTYTRRTKNGYLYTFDANGYLQTAADRNNNTMTYAYDADNLLTSVTDPVGKVTQLSYANGKLASITDPANRVTSFEHDANGDLVTVTFPDDSTREFTYDQRHLMSSQTDQRGFTNTYEYNHAGQASRATQADGSVRTLVPSQSIGLVDPSEGTGTAAEPAKLLRQIGR